MLNDEPPDKIAIFRFDGAEHGFVVAHRVHLVYRDHEVRDAEQRRDVAMPPRLLQHAVARVDQDHGQIGGGRAGGHVARVLLVPRRVGDDEFAPRRGEIAIRDVDGDALLPLGAQAVRQQRKIDGPRGPVHRRFGHSLELIFVNALRIVEQPTDQRGLAIVHAARGGKSQQVLGLLRGQEIFNLERGGAIGESGHQK